MGRRSPVLGYNHNVRYRGLVFHVQTEDSGIVNPHLFTHLFHGGVIVSTRKLVYDPDADDGVVKSLMQAQHKAVMKELRRGLFDDKIDVNLRGTPGLLPRGVEGDGGEDTGVGKDPAAAAAEQRALDAIVDPGSQPVIQIVAEAESEPQITMTADSEPSSPEIEVTLHPNMTPPGIPVLELPADRTVPTPPPSAARGRPVESVPPLPPPPRGAPPSQPIRRASTPPPLASASLPPIPPSQRPQSTVRGAPPVPKQQQSMTPPVVMTRPITRERPGDPAGDVSQAFEAITTPPPGLEDIEVYSPAPSSAPPPPGAQGAQGAQGERASEYIHRRGSGERPIRDEFRSSQRIPTTATPPAPPAPPARPEPRPVTVQPARRSGSQPHSAVDPRAAKPGTGPIAVPNAVDRVGSRPLPNVTEQRVKSPPVGPPAAPPSTPAPRGSTDRRPETPAPQGRAAPQHAAPTPGSQPIQARTPTPGTPAAGAGTAGTRGTPPENAVPVPRTRTPTAPRPFSAPSSTPRQGTPAPAGRARSGSDRAGGGVVMSRPAVIVGARANPTPSPPQPPAATQPPSAESRTQTGGARVRRAREEGGRGVFGQDLISEKSLDEVILAYLSEDANEE